MAKMYYDKDADLKMISDDKVAIIGYGIQGRGQALCLRDSGINVLVSELEGTPNYEQAVKERKESKVKLHCNNIVRFLGDAKSMLDIDKRYAFETGIIHGDWHGGNLLFIGEKLNGIIDMEFADDGCYLEDIAYAVSNLCIRTSVKANKLLYRTNLLLNAYENHRTLSYAEKVALYYAVGVKHITTVSYQLPQQGGRVAGYTPPQWMTILDYQTQWLAQQSHKARWGE